MAPTIYQRAISHFYCDLTENLVVQLCLYVVVIGAVVIFVLVDTWDDKRRLVGAGGALVLILVGWVFSVHPGKVRFAIQNFVTLSHVTFINIHFRWRQVVWGHTIQFIFALIALR